MFNGETRYYYNIVNNNVIIYHRDAENEEANEYGFLEESFGTFGTQVEWNDKTYYANNGFTITFSRDAATAEEYPIPYSENEDGELISEPLESLTFTPTGAEEFTVSGTVIIADNEFDCYVSRVLGEDGKYSMSLIIALNSNAYYVYDITTTYRGSNIANSSVYTISGMRHVVEYQAYKYLYYYYMAYYLYAQQLPNTFGIVTISTEYNAAGEAGEAVLAAQFGGNSGMYDTEGNLLSIEGVSFESESGVYHVVFDGADGYTYGFYFTTAYMQQLGVYGYQVIAMVREETLTDSKTGITVEIERVIASDSSNYTAGSIFSMSLSKDGEQLENALIGYFDDKLCYIIREEDAEGNKTTTYYWVEFTEGASEDENVIPLYTQVSVTEEAVTTYYTSDGNGYIDVDGENNVLIIGIYDEESEQTAAYIAVSSTYDESTKTYTVNLSETVAYTVTVGEDGSVTMQLVEQTEDEESGAEDGEAA